MKYSRSILPVFLLMSISVYSHATLLFDGVISHWTFDRGMGKVMLDDISANDGQMLVPDWTEGISNWALEFNGSDYIRIPDAVSLRQNNQDWSVGFWMKSDVARQNTMILSKKQDIAPYEQYSIGLSRGNSYSWGIGSKITFLFRENKDSEKGGYTTDDINFSQWTQVFIVLDKNANTVRVYINGSQVPVTLDHNGAFPNLNNPDNLLIGGNPRFISSQLYFGTLDEVCIYNRVLTDEEILLNYNYYGAEPIPASIDFWPARISLSCKGQWITAEFALPKEYNVYDVELDSIFLEDTISPCLTMYKKKSNSLVLVFTQQQIEKYLQPGDNELFISARLSDKKRVEGIGILHAVQKKAHAFPEK